MKGLCTELHQWEVHNTTRGGARELEGGGLGLGLLPIRDEISPDDEVIQCRSEGIDGRIFLSLRGTVEDFIGHVLGQIEANATEELEDLSLRPRIAHDHGADRQIRKGRGIDEILRWYIITIVLRVG